MVDFDAVVVVEAAVLDPSICRCRMRTEAGSTSLAFFEVDRFSWPITIKVSERVSPSSTSLGTRQLIISNRSNVTQCLCLLSLFSHFTMMVLPIL